MDKMKMITTNRADENFKKFSELFPNAITETIDENGVVVRAIDKDILAQELSAYIVDGSQERYQFTWPDKRKAMLLANTPVSKTLRLINDRSFGKDGLKGGIDSENMYIEGDNLDALKILREAYLGKIKLIYIDPPYNTGHDFVYNDDFHQNIGEYIDNSGQTDSSGNRLVQNTEGNGRFHTDWLNMIYPRIILAKDLLTSDGIIAISIDDNEVDNLRKICDEIFGSACFVSLISWQKTYSPRNNNLGIAAEVEYVLIYSKMPGWAANRLPRTESMNDKYKNPDNDSVLWKASDSSAPGASTHQGMVYAIQNPITGEYIYPPKGRCWSREQNIIFESMQKWAKYKLVDLHDEKQRAEICGIDEDSVRVGVCAIVLDEPIEKARDGAQKLLSEGPWPLFYFTNNGKGGIGKKSYLDQVQDRTPTNFWPYEEAGHTDEALKELKQLFDGSSPFDTPKPTRLIKRILDIVPGNDYFVLDFFSGSATSADAVLQKNAEDNGSRKMISIQVQEETSGTYKTITAIGEERIHRSGIRIKSNNPLTTIDLDIGFRCFTVDSSNMKDVYYKPSETKQVSLDDFTDNIKEDRTSEDLLIQVMLDLGILLSSKIDVIELSGKKVYSVADGYLYACLDNNIDEILVEKIAKQTPYYAVFRDSGYANDSVAANFEQIFDTYSPNTIRKVL